MGDNICPECLGSKEIYDKKLDNVVECDVCHGQGTVSEVINDMYYHTEEDDTG